MVSAAQRDRQCPLITTIRNASTSTARKAEASIAAGRRGHRNGSSTSVPTRAAVIVDGLVAWSVTRPTLTGCSARNTSWYIGKPLPATAVALSVDDGAGSLIEFGPLYLAAVHGLW
jgi:hypothetical protein